MTTLKGARIRSRVIENVRVSPTAFILRFERNGIEFEPGQHLIVGPADIADMREYSVYSSTGDPFLEILVREIPDGYVSRLLGCMR